MDEAFKAKLLKYLDGLETAAGKVQDFASAEIPLFVREWLLWHAVSNAVYAVGFLLVAVAALWVGVRLVRWGYGNWNASCEEYKAAKNDSSRRWAADEAGNRAAGVIFGGLVLSAAGLFGFAVAGHFALAALKVAVAPRVVVVEKIAELAGRKVP